MSGARPLVVGVAELHRQPGTQRAIEREALLPGLAVAGSAVPDDAVVSAELVLESLSDGTVTAAGTVRAPWVGECRRCLGPVQGEVVTAVREIFEAHPTEGETYRLDGEQVDLEPLVRDAVLLALPLAPLCRPDCPGPEPDAFPVGQPGAVRSTPSRDPRWDVLDELHLGDDPAPGAAG